jgi:transglutaminase-like putative cysteine protease
LTIRAAIHHVTRYRYDRPVTLLPQVVRLRPAPHTRTPIVSYSLRVKPGPHFLNWQQDPFGNYQARVVFLKPAEELVVEVDLVAEMAVTNPFDFFLETAAEHYPFAYAPALRRDLAPYLEQGAKGPLFADFVERARSEDARSGRRTIDVLVDLNRRVQRKLKYDVRMEPGVFAPEESLQRGHGSCRDFAWLLVQMLRGLGLAARFVSGYSIQLKADEKPVEGPAGVAEDATDLHAWAEVFLPGAGWVGLDATSGLLAGEGHIPLACTPDPETAAAITGSYEWAKRGEDDRVREELSFSMSVARIEETPRVTLPYTDATWMTIDALGRRVDRALEDGDVRLTMGGEPTFVSADDPDGAEWNIDAMGPTKRRYATRLSERLYDRFTPGGLVHEGQGKWYPGEPLPRWALSCYFRKDGEAIWERPWLFDRRETGPETAADAHSFAQALARQLGLDPKFAIPGYEDAWYYLWRERRLPANVDPFDSRLDDENERARLARVFEQGLPTVVGYALPVARARQGDG